MGALTPQERTAHSAVVGHVFGAVRQITALPDGYLFLLDQDRPMLKRIAEFIGLERRCCPFFSFTVSIPAGANHAELAINGPSGVHPFIQAEFAAHLPATVQFPTTAR